MKHIIILYIFHPINSEIYSHHHNFITWTGCISTNGTIYTWNTSVWNGAHIHTTHRSLACLFVLIITELVVGWFFFASVLLLSYFIHQMCLAWSLGFYLVENAMHAKIDDWYHSFIETNNKWQMGKWVNEQQQRNSNRTAASICSQLSSVSSIRSSL